MTEIRYSIDLHESNRAGKIVRVVFGVACLVAGIWYITKISGTPAATSSSWIATGFLLLFGLWMIGSGLGYTKRYITVGDDMIILRQEFYRPPLIFTPGSLKAVGFSTLRLEFITDTGSTILRLGTYYPEHTAAIMTAVEEFCRRNSVKMAGDGTAQTGSEGSDTKGSDNTVFTGDDGTGQEGGKGTTPSPDDGIIRKGS
jgi:hypothetical protein